MLSTGGLNWGAGRGCLLAGRAQAALSWLSKAVQAGSGCPKTPKPHAGGIQTGRVGLWSIAGELACERLNLLSFSSPERSFWDAGLWAELCVCSPLMPEPPTHCDVVRVSDSGPGAFQFAGSGIPFQGILCQVAWKQVEMGQLRTMWGSRASWGHWMGTRLPGPLAVPAFP